MYVGVDGISGKFGILFYIFFVIGIFLSVMIMWRIKKYVIVNEFGLGDDFLVIIKERIGGKD